MQYPKFDLLPSVSVKKIQKFHASFRQVTVAWPLEQLNFCNSLESSSRFRANSPSLSAEPEHFSILKNCLEPKNFLQKARSLMVVVSSPPTLNYEMFTKKVREYNAKKPFNFTMPELLKKLKVEKVFPRAITGIALSISCAWAVRKPPFSRESAVCNSREYTRWFSAFSSTCPFTRRICTTPSSCTRGPWTSCCGINRINRWWRSPATVPGSSRRLSRIIHIRVSMCNLIDVICVDRINLEWFVRSAAAPLDHRRAMINGGRPRSRSKYRSTRFSSGIPRSSSWSGVANAFSRSSRGSERQTSPRPRGQKAITTLSSLSCVARRERRDHYVGPIWRFGGQFLGARSEERSFHVEFAQLHLRLPNEARGPVPAGWNSSEWVVCSIPEHFFHAGSCERAKNRNPR